MKDQIPQLLQTKLKIKNYSANDLPEELKEFIVAYNDFYSWGITDLKIILRVMRNNITILPICTYPDCSNPVKIDYKGDLTEGCCKGHTVMATNLKRYGVTCTQQIKDIKNKTKNTMVERYGFEHALQNKKIKSKAENTMVERYGVTNISENKDYRIKAVNTMIARYGVNSALKLTEFKVKSKITSLRKYGTEHPMQNIDNRIKFENTMLEKYGVINPSHNADMISKSRRTALLKKEFIWKTGEISVVQGYEPIVLKELEDNGYRFHDIKTSPSDMPEIWYEFNDKQHRYYPDFFIPTENLVIEVKSNYTLNTYLDINTAKFNAVKDAGFNFRLEVR